MADLTDLVTKLIEAKLRGEKPQPPPQAPPMGPPPISAMPGIPPEVLMAHGKLFGPGAKWGGPGQKETIPGNATADEWAMERRPRALGAGVDMRLK